ncbi:unnamed protein product [Mycetohabitans rhizoxinica HKI 454]|uniref:Uncharacterized protein n=1 Tax=Mycetohabitans rhizoxinica (strain DSM 19002 / CIP 109453 / HKI 454) TaxID=882378 RepID=E5AM68_MYCRK|nr:unnamed protein product [Mycetohabitans rhizoxinica HKI 454]
MPTARRRGAQAPRRRLRWHRQARRRVHLIAVTPAADDGTKTSGYRKYNIDFIGTALHCASG